MSLRVIYQSCKSAVVWSKITTRAFFRETIPVRKAICTGQISLAKDISIPVLEGKASLAIFI